MGLGLTDKRALVLGASRGLGGAIARTLALEGARVTAAARGEAAIEAWAGALPGEAGGRVTAARLDLFDIASIDALADRLLEAGFTEGEVHTMAVVNTRMLAGA